MNDVGPPVDEEFYIAAGVCTSAHMLGWVSAIRFDVVLRRDETKSVLAAVGALASQRRLSGNGVSQSRDRIRQFRFAADEANQWWSIVFDDNERYEYRDGVYSYLGRRCRRSWR
ncbi:hypothetical protein LK09_09845 [Microbacterium mangrovi]|uniref:Uncharacterized protein n=1 Tax=Microbacterium mangrovi TaxID=1348253 RepID=A0A0B2A447_9MICO|nr:hypothetical protein [Microbacterium mangrovi]KHK97790.1 hypothetical protein LK09_09845 [Microbacterium mangrovi]